MKSPIWLEYTLSKSALWPHQIGTVQEALQKWPIKNLFADEVGLEKLRSWCNLKYLHTHKNIKKFNFMSSLSYNSMARRNE